MKKTHSKHPGFVVHGISYSTHVWYKVNLLFQAKHGITGYVYPELKNLYNILEVDFHPLKLYEKIKPSMEFIMANDDLMQYVPALEDIIVTRVLKQVRHPVCLWLIQ